MTIRAFGFVAAISLFAVLLSIPVAAQSSGGSTSASTPDGQPDLSGVWDFRTVTPLERPEEFGDQAFLSEEEVAAYAAERVLENNADLNREEKKEIINEHRIEVKNTVDVDAILKKAINKGINQLDSPKQVH